MIIFTSPTSLIGQHNLSVQAEKLKIDQWYDDIFNLIFDEDNVDEIDEKDIVMAVEASLFAMDFGIEACEIEERDEDEDGPKSRSGQITYYDLKMKRVRSRKSTFSTGADGESASRKFFASKSFEGTIFDLRRIFGTDNNQSQAGGHESDEEEGQDNKDGLFGQQNITDGWFLAQYLKDDSKDNRHKKKFIALVAWSIAGLGLLLALCFLTRDFVRSSMENTSTIEYTDAEELSIPKLWFCPSGTQQPMFYDRPDGYQGVQMFWIDFVRGGKDDINIVYPDTHRMPQVEYTTITPHGIPCNGSSIMSPDAFYMENFEPPKCFHCIIVKQTPPIKIERPKEGAIIEKSHVSIRLSLQSFPSMCRAAQRGMRLGMLKFFRSAMLNHSSELEARGILRFGGLDPKAGENVGLFYPLYRVGNWNATIDLVVTDVVDMYCNVYMFSGYFYPVTKGDIRYAFDSTQFRWRRVGNGPYFPRNFEEWYGSDGINWLDSHLRYDRSLDRMRYNESVLNGDSVTVLTNSSRLRNMETVTVIRPTDFVRLAFTRNLVNGAEFYDSHVIAMKLERGEGRAISNVFFLDLMFHDFFTRRVAEQQAMSWTAFLADFFGLTSLFLDISVYTILVSPIVGRRAARKHKTRKQANESERVTQRSGWSRKAGMI